MSGKNIGIGIAVLLVLFAGAWVLRNRTISTASIVPSGVVPTKATERTLSPDTSVASQDVAAYEPVTEIPLKITSPKNNATVTSASLTVNGNTVANAEVFVNDSETVANANGDFSVTLTLEEGDNYILVIANNEQGYYSEQALTVIYAP